MSTLPPYQLSIDGFHRDHFRVHSFKGKEAMSEAWSFDLVVTAEAGGEPVERAVLGQRAAVLFNIGDEQRAFYGVVASARLAQVHDANHTIQYQVRVVPRLWLLKRKKRTRIFQKMRVTDIVTAVLNEAGIATRWQLTRAYPMREYCTQYEETDYKFVKRLLAEAGIYFYFPTGPAVDDATLTADMAIGAAAAAGSSLVGAVAGADVGGLVGAAVSVAETLIPGDTVICADDASCYPPVNGDDPAALAASTAAALAPAVGDVLGAGDGIAGAALGTASAIAGTVIAEVSSAAHEIPVLRFLQNEEARVSIFDKVTRFTLRNTVRSTGAMFRDYDPDRPMVRLQSSAVSTAPFPPSPFEAAAMAAAAAENAASAIESAVPLPGAATDALHTVETFVDKAESVVNQVAGALGQKVPHEVYEHHSPFLFPKWAFANDEAPRILRQKRRRASIAHGEGGCSDLSPGHRFALHDHPAAQLDGTYVVTSVEHRGETRPEAGSEWRVYWNELECAPSEMAYVPPRPKRKSVQVALTATVVGPPGEEIWVDSAGQIKVQFHWDRDGKYDDQSSCWIRVMQPWGGAGWGHQFIPRVGMEVVVVFEGGDTDKPMVLGSLYNGTHPPPFKLPENKTRSGIRTSTYPGGQGHNELSFEDHTGHEQVYVHAQRDYHEVVENNHTSDIHGGKQTTVDRDSKKNVRGSAHLHVEGGRTEDIGQDDRLRVKGSVHRDIDRDERTTVLGMSSTTVHKTQAVEVRGAYSLTVGTEDEPSASDHAVYGTASIQATKQLIVRAEEGLRLVCGESIVEVLPDKIVLKTPTLELSASESMTASAKEGGPSMTIGDEIEMLSKKVKIFSEGGALELDKDAKIAGKKIKLGYDPSKPEKKKDEKSPETQPLKCSFSDYWMEPYAGKHYHLTVDGLRFEGTTDGDGTITADIPKSATQALVRIWTDDYPEGRQQLYSLQLKDELPPATSIHGGKLRLKNLGYYTGDLDEVADDALLAAVAEFQDDHKDSHALDVTGKYDQTTQDALVDVYGS
jgi:type VI secretion system secreted protein VgrG